MEVLECLRSGRNACYILYDRVCGRKVFMKCGDTVQIENEAAALARFSGSGVPALYGGLSHGGSSYVFTEYIEGMTLKDYISEKGVLSERESIEIAVSVCRVLSRLHSCSPAVIHRDIKTENILITGDKKIYIIDFEISREYDGGAERDQDVQGTPRTAPPEQFGYAQTDERSDVYSVGILLNELLCGKSKPEKPVKGRLGKIIDRCTCFDPGQRYKNAMELEAELENCYKPRRDLAVAALFLTVTVIALLSGTLLNAKLGKAVQDDDSPVYEFKDEAIEELVRSELEKPEGEITEKDLLDVRTLSLIGDSVSCVWSDIIVHGKTLTVKGVEINDYGSVETLEDLAHMPNLDTVILCNQNISDISPLKDSDIRYLSLHGNEIEDVSVLESCKELVGLDVSSNPIKSLSPVSSLYRLSDLNAGATDIETLDDIAEIDNLSRLEIHDCVHLKDMSALKDMEGLTFLSLRPVGSEAFECIRGLKSMMHLYIWNAGDFVSVSQLEGMDELRSLGADSCGLTTLEGVENLKNLNYITFRYTAVRDISPLTKAEKLITVALTGADISDYSPLSEIKYLGEIYCSSSQENIIRKVLSGNGSVEYRLEDF